MAISAESNWAQVTDLASSLVVETGIDWRRAHRIVGGFVRLAIDAGLRPQTVGLDTLDEAAEQVTGEPSGLGEEAFAAAMSARAFVERRTMIGAPGPVAVRRESAAAAQAVAQDRERLSAVRASVDEAATDLESAIDAIVSSGA
jgi:argininosuccinate lyase